MSSRGPGGLPFAPAVPLEPPVALTWLDEDRRLVVRTSAESPFRVRGLLAERLGIPAARIRVVRPLVAGGAGGRSDVADRGPVRARHPPHRTTRPPRAHRRGGADDRPRPASAAHRRPPRAPGGPPQRPRGPAPRRRRATARRARRICSAPRGGRRWRSTASPTSASRPSRSGPTDRRRARRAGPTTRPPSPSSAPSKRRRSRSARTRSSSASATCAVPTRTAPGRSTSSTSPRGRATRGPWASSCRPRPTGSAGSRRSARQRDPAPGTTRPGHRPRTTLGRESPGAPEPRPRCACSRTAPSPSPRPLVCRGRRRERLRRGCRRRSSECPPAASCPRPSTPTRRPSRPATSRRRSSPPGARWSRRRSCTREKIREAGARLLGVDPGGVEIAGRRGAGPGWRGGELRGDRGLGPASRPAPGGDGRTLGRLGLAVGRRGGRGGRGRHRDRRRVRRGPDRDPHRRPLRRPRARRGSGRGGARLRPGAGPRRRCGASTPTGSPVHGPLRSWPLVAAIDIPPLSVTFVPDARAHRPASARWPSGRPRAEPPSPRSPSAVARATGGTGALPASRARGRPRPPGRLTGRSPMLHRPESHVRPGGSP